MIEADSNCALSSSEPSQNLIHHFATFLPLVKVWAATIQLQNMAADSLVSVCQHQFAPFAQKLALHCRIRHTFVRVRLLQNSWFLGFFRALGPVP